MKREIYDPQIKGLLNLLIYVSREYGRINHYPSIEDLERVVVERAQSVLRERLGIASLRNPFKSTLEHWTLDDQQKLPGRGEKIRTVIKHLAKSSNSLVLLKGRSGCGKSSMLQRGVLAELRDKGFLAFAFRPTDIVSPSISHDQADCLWGLICDVVQCGNNAVNNPRIRPNRHKLRAAHLCETLSRRGLKLALGIDQFEEILDELKLLEDKHHENSGWQHVLDFLSLASSSTNVSIVATLESSRTETFERLQIEQKLGLQRVTVGVDVSADDVAKIAQQGFQWGGLKLEGPLLEEIKSKWELYDKEMSSVALGASPLPLACLWLAALYERFEDRATPLMGEGLDEAFSRVQFRQLPTLAKEDLGDEGVAFENMIQKLADQAWTKVEGASSFITPIEADPNYSTLSNFFSPLIGLDSDGFKRLLVVTEHGADHTITQLISEFKNSRLLVRTSDSNSFSSDEPFLLRLVHQAVIDHWRPASLWFEERKNYLKLENEYRLEALAWSSRGKYMPVKNRQSIHDAAVILASNRGVWENNQSKVLDAEQETFRDQMLSIFSRSSTPNAMVKSNSGFSFAHIAAAYHIVDLLRIFVKKSPRCLKKLSKRGDTLLHVASWNDGPATRFLLDHGVPMTSKELEWNAIAAAIQMHKVENYYCLIEKFDDINQSVGPGNVSMLHVAARYGNLDVIEDLIARGAKQNRSMDDGWLPIHDAASSGQLGAVLRLFPYYLKQVDVKENNSVLGIAAMYGHVNIVEFALNSELINSKERQYMLLKPDVIGFTPIMSAAGYRQPEVLQLLLENCDPSSRAHITKDGRTLLHLAVSSPDRDKPSDEEKVNARRCVQILIENDKRIDPCIEDSHGHTAFDIAKHFSDARRVMRHDSRMPTDYDTMTTEMRIDDLSSHNPGVVLRFVRQAPQALTDLHNQEPGMQILMRLKKIPVLATVVSERLLQPTEMSSYLDQLIEVAGLQSALPLRTALVDSLIDRDNEGCVQQLQSLLNLAFEFENDDLIQKMREANVTQLRGTGALLFTQFHFYAVKGEVEKFARSAQYFRLAIPLDAWGRTPSDLAADSLRESFIQMEQEFFDHSEPVEMDLELPKPTKFHELAKAGDAKGFERQARGVCITVPLDEDGQKPSDVAPENAREEFVQLENDYFARRH